MTQKILLLSGAFLLLFHMTVAYKYLAILHTAARSHHIVGSALMKGLAKKGHDVTIISPFPQKEPVPNIRDIPLNSMEAAMQDEMDKLAEYREKSIIDTITHFHEVGVYLTRVFFEDPGVQQLMQSNETFDAVICEVFLSEAIYGLSEHFNAPLIGLGTFGAIAWNTDMVGSPSPPSYVPSAMLHFTDHMTLIERIGNLAFLTFERLLLDLYYLPKQEAVYKQYFPNNKRSMYDIRRNAALVLLNQHVSLSFPRPYMPNQIEVGGMHINRERKPLPADIENFLKDAKHGAIYFSMGSNLKSKDLPLEKREIILNTFRSLKQRVLWKFEDSTLENVPDNVYISAWFPQDDILAHKQVKAFITHGGLLSTTESIYHGKPFIGIPMFGDQFLNMARAEKYGYGIQLDYTQFSESAFKSAIDSILSNPSYADLVGKMSERFHDQPMRPLDLAVYWIEHVVRHKGAQYLHCAGLDLNFIQYHNIDALLILYGGLLLTVVLFVYLVRFLWRLLRTLCTRKDKKQKKQKKQ